MAAAKGRSDVQRRLEGGASQQDVVIFSLAMKEVACAPLTEQGGFAAGPDFEAAMRRAIAETSGTDPSGVAVTFMAMVTKAAVAASPPPMAEAPAGEWYGEQQEHYDEAQQGYWNEHAQEQQAWAGDGAYADADAAGWEQQGHYEAGDAGAAHWGGEYHEGAEYNQGEHHQDAGFYNPPAEGGDDYAYQGEHQQHVAGADGHWGQDHEHQANGYPQHFAQDAVHGTAPPTSLDEDIKQPTVATPAMGIVTLEVSITPDSDGQASNVVASLKRKLDGAALTKFGEAIGSSLLTSHVTKSLCPSGVKVSVTSPPEVVKAMWPELRLGAKHGVQARVFGVLDSVQAMNDARQFQKKDGTPHPTACRQVRADEVTWALGKISDLFKDAKLEKLFVLVATSLLRRSRISCIQYASTISPSVLRHVLFDNPVKEEIFQQNGGASQQQALLLQYMSCAPTLIAMAAMAGDIAKRWAEDMAPEDKAFLSEVAGGFSDWPGLSVPMAKGLWERAACRFIVLDGMARSKGGAPGAIRYLRRCPKDVVASLFKAVWRGPSADSSFFYMFDAFEDPVDVHSRGDFLEILIDAFAQPTSDLGAALKAYVEDWDWPSEAKKDFLVALISECRQQDVVKAPEPVERKRCFIWSKSTDDKPKKKIKVPSTAGIENIILNAVQGAFSYRVSRSEHPGDCQDLADMFEVALLLCSGENVLNWAKKKVSEEPRIADEFRRFLRSVGLPHLTSIFKSAAKQNKAKLYLEEEAGELADGTKLWTFESRHKGKYSEQIAAPGQRNAEDFTQLLLSYVTIELTMSKEGSNMWDFVRALDEGSGSMAETFKRFAPGGSQLRIALAKEVRRSFGENRVDVGKIQVLLDYYGFFSPPFRRILYSPTAIKELRESIGTEGKVGGVDILFMLLKTVLTIISRQRGSADQDPVEALSVLCRQLQVGGPVGWQLFSKVLEEVTKQELQGFSLGILGDCAKELGKSGQLLERKMQKNKRTAKNLLSGAMRAISAALEKCKDTSGWAAALRPLDTVIFTLEYMGKEDFNLAQARFKWEIRRASHRRKVLWELLGAVGAIYRAPLVGNDASGMDADMDMRDFIKRAAPELKNSVWWRGVEFSNVDWGAVLEIAGAAAEGMKQRFNVVMIPHHVQIMTMLMFAFRACGVMGSEKGAQSLPKTMLARVGTGEGKSLIIAMLAAFVAKKGLRAHVINDNRVLTKRDFDTNVAMFEALGLTTSSDPASLQDPKCQIVYCAGDDVEQACLDCLTEGNSKQYEESLKTSVLIVDEVDGMIFDKGPASLKEFADREFSEWVNTWLEQLETKGSIERDFDNFRAFSESQSTIQREVEEAYNAMYAKKEGVHFTERGKALYLLDEKTHMIKEGVTVLWLEAMKRTKYGQSAAYKYVKAVLCRLQCFMSYSCIFGLTGSLGQQAEQDYLTQYYDAMSFTVPFFLDTCRNDEEEEATADGKPAKPPAPNDLVIILDELGDSSGAKFRKGTKGNLARLVERKQEQKMCRVDLGDNRELWYKEACLARCVSSKKQPSDVGQGKPFKGEKAQEEAVVTLASAKCKDVPVLVLAKNTDAVHRMAAALRQALGPQWGEDKKGVIELLHNPHNPREFVDLVDLSTEPLHLDQATQGFRISITTAEGGRGHDYRVVDPGIDDRGGLLLILTWVPWSEREWIQFLGRTGRQDHAGQYAVCLNSEDDQVKSASKEQSRGESLPLTILRKGNDQTAAMLKGVGIDIDKARLMHRLSSMYWTEHKHDKTDKNNDWAWKRLCGEYSSQEPQKILENFQEQVLPEQKMDTQAILAELGGTKASVGKYAPSKASPLLSMAELTCQKCGHVNFANWSPDQELPKVNCERCSAKTIVSSFVPVYASSL